MQRRALLACLALAACTRPQTPLVDNPAPLPAIGWDNPTLVEVILDEYGFTPADLVLQVNRPVLLRLVNRGARGHDFRAPSFFATVAFRPGYPAGEQIRAERGAIDVAARGSAEVLLLPLSPGTFALECSKPLHAMFGMTGAITVLPDR